MWSKFIWKIINKIWSNPLCWGITLLRAIRGRFVANHVLVLGDSHIRAFYYWQFDLKFPKMIFNFCMVPGATASGLENPNSKTKAYQKFERAIQKYPSQIYILLLGEVDTGFVIWYRAQKYGIPVDEMLNLAVDKYKRFISKIRVLGKVIVISVPLPTISDGKNRGKIAKVRKHVKASQRERTKLALTFNKRIAQICNSEDVLFIDLDPFSLDENGLVKKELINGDPCNHHYNPLVYSRLLLDQLKHIL